MQRDATGKIKPYEVYVSLRRVVSYLMKDDKIYEECTGPSGPATASKMTEVFLGRAEDRRTDGKFDAVRGTIPTNVVMQAANRSGAALVPARAYAPLPYSAL